MNDEVRSCDNCRYNEKRKRCSKCITSDKIVHSKFKAKYKLLEAIRLEMVEWQKLEELMESMKEHKENDMEHKTKAELQSSIENMETELVKMKEALKKAEEGEIWKPRYGEFYFHILGDFTTIGVIYNAFDHERAKLSGLNCFKTQEEANEAARDIKTLFMLYRLSRKSMAREGSKNPTYYITADAKIGRLYNVDCSKEPLHFASALEAQKAIEIIGKENLIELLKKF